MGEKMKEDIAKLPRGSKMWWSKTGALLSKSQKVCSMPALKNKEGKWIRDAAGKADLFATTFSSKYVMPAAADNEFSAIVPWTCTWTLN